MEVRSMKCTCGRCGKKQEFEVDVQAYLAWQGGMKVQDAFPKEDAFFRERLITGMCYDCISTIFNKPKPGEYWGEIIGECEVCGTPLYEDRPICPNNCTVDE